jgi:Rrf2 family protein
VTISKSCEYALRAVVQLAEQPDGPHSTAALATRAGIPVGYLSKVLQELVRAGLVISRPGRTGGFVLSRRADDIAVLDIVNAVSPIERIRTCPLGNPAHAALCPLHRRLDDVAQATETAFRNTSIAQLLSSNHFDAPLCPLPADAGERQDGPVE